MEALYGFAVFMGALIVVLATGAPVAVATGLLGVLGVYLFLPPAAMSQLANIAFSQSSNYVLVVVPLFIMMGEALSVTSISKDLFTAARLWLRRLPGALAVATIFACACFAAVCGSSPVTAGTIGKMSVPEMIRNRYDPGLAFGATAAGGTLGILIPPSIPMILYGVITETSIGSLFIAGIVPGLMIAVFLVATVMLKVWRDPNIAPHGEAFQVSRREKLQSLGSVGPVLVLIVAVLGSIYAGIATPIEAGAVGAAGALIIARAMGFLKRTEMGLILSNTVATTAMFVLLIIGGLFSAFVLARLGIPQGMATWLVSSDVPPWLILVFINFLLVVLGMFMDPMSLLVMIVPVFFPAVVALGYDAVWFGVMVVVNLEIAAITPPVGFNLFVLKSVVPNADMREIINGSLIFVAPLAIGIGILIAWPEVALFLPRLMMN